MKRLATALALVSLLGGAACSHPYRGPKRLGALGLGLLGGGGIAWAAGDRADNPGLTTTGFFLAAVGFATTLAAGGWLAVEAGCQGDFQCPDDEACREIPAPPGATPYKQCMKR